MHAMGSITPSAELAGDEFAVRDCRTEGDRRLMVGAAGIVLEDIADDCRGAGGRGRFLGNVFAGARM